MIDVKILTKSKSQASGSGSSSSKSAYINTTVSEAEHALKADKATRASASDNADYATKAGTAITANYATTAGNLDKDAEVLDDYLYKGETTEAQEVKGKVTFDEAITFLKGLESDELAKLIKGATFGEGGASIDHLGNALLSSLQSLDYANAAEQGFSIEKDANGKYHQFITNLTVWGKAIFHELEIRKLSYAGGNIYLSGAGSKLVKVVPVAWDNSTSSWKETTETECEGWKCYLLADDGTTATQNYWQEGDQVRCQTMGEITSAGTYQDASNKAYWRTIPDNGVSTANEKIYGTKTETYTDDEGNEQTREVQVELYDGQGFAWIVIGKHSLSLDNYTEETAPTETKDYPEAGDTIVLDGNRHRDTTTREYDKVDRQNIILLETTGDDAPRIVGYYHITEYKHTYTNTDGKETPLYVFLFSAKEGVKLNSSQFEWISSDGSTINMPNYRGDWSSSSTYYKNDQVSHNNTIWICVADSGTKVADEPSSSSVNWQMVISGGKQGEDAYQYNLLLSPNVLHLDKDGNFVTNAVSGDATKATIAANFYITKGGEMVEVSANNFYYGLIRNDNSEKYSGATYREFEISNTDTNITIVANHNGIMVAQQSIAIVKDGTDAVSYCLESQPGYIKLASDGSFDRSNQYSEQTFLFVSGYKITNGKKTSDFATNDKPITTRLSFNDGDAYTEYIAYGDSNVQVDFEPTYYNSYYSLLQEMANNGLRNARAIMYEGNTYSEDKVLASLDIPIVKDGADGNGSESYSVNLTKGTKYISSVQATVLYVSFIHQKGAAATAVYKLSDLGSDAKVKCYIDGVESEDMESRANSDSDYIFFDFSGWQSYWNGKSTLTFALYLGSTMVASANFALGQQGAKGDPGEDAYRVEVTPSALVFDTNDDGRVTSYPTDKTATIRVYKGSTDVSSQFTKSDVYPSNYSNCNGRIVSLSSSPLEIKVTNIETENVTTDDETVTVSKTNGFLEFALTNGSATVTAHVDVQVNLVRYTGGLVAGRKSLASKYTELSNKVDDLPSSESLTEFKSELIQTAREISLSVSEKTVGRRNLLVGSAFRKQDEGCEIVLSGHYDDNGIQINAGKDGTNCIKVKAASSTDYSGAFWRQDGTSGANVKIKHNTKYVLSAYVKVASTNVTVSTEVIYRKGESGSTASDRDGRPTSVKLVSPALVAGEWQLHYFIFETDGSHDYIEANVWICGSGTAYICKPMLEEGDSYNGWTLSEQDYDYVGGNLLDNTRTLQVGDSLDCEEGTITKNGYGDSNYIFSTFQHEILGTVSSKYYLPSSSSYGDAYLAQGTRTVWTYTGTSLSDDTHYKGYEAVEDGYKECLRWLITSLGIIKANQDYMMSFMAKGAGRLNVHLYPSSSDTFIESSEGYLNESTDGYCPIDLTSEWKRYWVHWRPGASDQTNVLIRLGRTYNSDGSAPITTAYLSQPKLEEGATITEYTERKTDLIDKASLKAAGIAIDSTSVTLYGDQVKVSSTQGGTPYAMFTDGKFNANLIEAKVLKTYNTDNGAHIEIENGLMSVFGTMGMPNIRFGVNDSGMAVLSYYDNNGTKLYDLGPGGLDASALKSATLSSAEYVLASKFLGTTDFYQMSSFANGKYTVYQVKSAYNAKLFGTQMYNDGDMEVKNNDSSHSGYKPFTSAATVTIYQYTAARIDGTIAPDTNHGLSAEMAAEADGKYFTSTTMVSGSTLVNLATGIYFRKDAAVATAPSPMVSVDEGSYKWPAYAVGFTKFQDGEVVTSGLEVSFYGRLFSTIERTFSASLLAK